MPAPPNTTPATATVIDRLPYSLSLSVADAPTGTGHASSCDSAQRRAVWFVLTPRVGQNVISALLNDGNASGYQPILSLWTGPVGSLTQLKVDPYGDQDFCGFNGANRWWEIPVTPGTPLYLQVTDANSAATLNALLNIQVVAQAYVTAPAGSYAIPDDTSSATMQFPLSIVSAVDGSFLQLPSFPPGEFAASLPTGQILTQDDTIDLTVTLKLYNAALALQATITPAGSVLYISANETAFYVLLGSGTARTLQKVLANGTLSTAWTLPASSNYAVVDRAEQYAYFINGGLLYKFTLASSTSALIHGSFAGEVAYRDAGITNDGSIWISYRNTSAPVRGKIRIFDTSGTVLQTYTPVSGTDELNHAAYWPGTGVSDPEAIALWIYANGSVFTDKFVRMRVSDGSILSTVTTPGSNISGQPAQDNAPFAVSNSCPFWLLRQPLVAPANPWVIPVGMLIVSKQAPDGPTVDFTIQAGGGLDPTSFTLRDGQTRTFTDVPAGDGYSIAEQLPAGWTLESAAVSNGSPLDNIAIAADEVVTVALVNAEEVCECCVATKISIINQALLKIGVSLTIASLDEQSREAFTGNQLYDPVLHETLRHWDWPFATKYAGAADQVIGYMNLIAGSVDDPVVKRPDGSPEWLYAYRYPVDCLKARRIVPTAGRKFDPDPIAFRAGRMWDGENVPIIYSNEVDAVLEYTAIVECAQDFFDALFEDALSWRLASKMAPSLSRNGLTVADCWKMYLHTVDTAKSVAAQEQQQEKGGDPDWIRGR